MTLAAACIALALLLTGQLLLALWRQQHAPSLAEERPRTALERLADDPTVTIYELIEAAEDAA